MEAHLEFQKFWIKTNASFLARYWITACEALERIKKDPSTYEEFQVHGADSGYVEAIVSSHLEHQCYSGVLLAYATLDEFFAVLIKGLGQLYKVRLKPTDLKYRGVRRYRKYIQDACLIDPSELKMDWEFLEAFSVVRDAIIHANGNKSLLGEPKKLEDVVAKYPGELSFKHSVKLVVESAFVDRCIEKTVESAMKLNKYISNKV